MPDPADEVIEAMRAGCPGHRPGTRVAYAAGIAATGWFQANAVARAHSDAEHFGGARVPVTVRFSNGSGAATDPDTQRSTRGMAVRFHLGSVEHHKGGWCTSSAATDLLASTLPVFFTKTLADFVDLARSTVPQPEPTPTWRRRLAARIEPLIGTLRMLPPDPDPIVGAAALVAFGDRHPPARLAVAASILLPVPESYATCCYHAVHAFGLTHAGVRTAVRFTWEPVAGVRPAQSPADRYLHTELTERLETGPAQFVLRAQVAEPGDDLADPTTAWSQGRRRLVLGQLSIDTVLADQTYGEHLAFDPTRMVPGIDIGEDEVLAARHDVYVRASAQRLQEQPAAATPG